MVQVLPALPSIGEHLGAVLAEFGGHISQGIKEHRANQKDLEIEGALNSPELTEMQRIGLVSRLSPQRQKTYASLLAPLLKQQGQAQQAKEQIGNAFQQRQQPQGQQQQTRQAQQPQFQSQQAQIQPQQLPMFQQLLDQTLGQQQNQMRGAPEMQQMQQPMMSPITEVPGHGMVGQQAMQAPQEPQTPLDAIAQQFGVPPLSEWSKDELNWARAQKRSPNPMLQQLAAVADIEGERRAETGKPQEKQLNIDIERGNEILKANSAKRQELFLRRADQEMVDDALASGKTGGLDMNFWAEVTGVNAFRTAEGAQLKSAGKNYFLRSLSQVGARPNQFLEKTLESAMVNVTNPVEANRVISAANRFALDTEEKRVELIEQYSEEERAKKGYVTPQIEDRATKALKPYVMQRQKELIGEVKDIKAGAAAKGANLGIDEVAMRSPDGEAFAVPKSDLKKLQKAGWSVVRQ
jgi:hypothetical protein